MDSKVFLFLLIALCPVVAFPKPQSSPNKEDMRELRLEMHQRFNDVDLEYHLRIKDFEIQNQKLQSEIYLLENRLNSYEVYGAIIVALLLAILVIQFVVNKSQVRNATQELLKEVETELLQRGEKMLVQHKEKMEEEWKIERYRITQMIQEFFAKLAPIRANLKDDGFRSKRKDEDQ